MSVLCQEILKRHSLRRTLELSEKRRHMLVDFMEWAGVLTLLVIVLSDHGRATSILRLLQTIIDR